VIGGSVKPYPKATFGKENVFGVRFQEEEYVFQTVSKIEHDDWIKAITNVQNAGLTSKDTIKEISRVL
jgi:hypothetical protein